MFDVITELKVDLKSLSDDQIRQLAVLNAYAINILIKDQDLSKDEYARILRLLGKNPKRGFWFEDEKNHEIMYVTNKDIVGDDKRKGLFAQGELNWHCNGPTALDPEDSVSLYCETPTKDPCNTEFTNGVLAWNTLPKDVQEQIRNTNLFITNDNPQFHRMKYDFTIKRKARPQFIDGGRSYTVLDAITKEEAMELNRAQTRNRGNDRIIQELITRGAPYAEEGGRWDYVVKPIVSKHRLTGIDGLYFPFMSVAGFDNIPEDEWKDLHAFLKDHYLKNVYSHQWESGDFILFDNTQGLHRRMNFPTDEHGEPQQRELWRGAFWYDGIQ